MAAKDKFKLWDSPVGIDVDGKKSFVGDVAFVVEVGPGEEYPSMVCAVAGPKENMEDGVEQHPESSKS